MLHRSLAQPPVFVLEGQSGGLFQFREPQGAVAKVWVLEEDVMRVAILPDGDWELPRSWSIAPGLDDVPHAGRAREDQSGFSCPAARVETQDGRITVQTARLRLTIRLEGFVCSWQAKQGEDWVPIARDRPTQAYEFGWWDGKPRHYQSRAEGEAYYGLGECTGDMDRRGRRIRLSNTDALGYSARSSDPLYKHIPFVIIRNAALGTSHGVFYDTMADCTFDFGCERSNYHGFFRSFEAENGDLDYYVIAGDTVADVSRRFTWLTGRPAFMPKWSLGYSGSTMSYTDAPDAQVQMNAFLERCATHDILCSSFHLSSGYTSIGSRRYVFNWNRDKFPDPAGFVSHYAAHGVRLVPNIKPCLLRDHPQFDACARNGLFIRNADGTPHLVQFWGELGALLDFTNPRTVTWWQAQVTSALLDVGMAATWNDNNEFEVRDPQALADFGGNSRPAIATKPLQTMLMVQASRAAQVAHHPGLRPFVVSRAGFAGMQRYAQSWSGDNMTGWETLKYNLRMGLGLALSGMSNTGHDVGGFAGPAPDEELFVRWVECGLFMPRFSIHSWNDDGTVNEPWMHAAATPMVRDLLTLRAKLAPYLYDLMWRAHRDYAPVIRPLFHDFPDDPACYDEHDEMLLGRALLVAPVMEPGLQGRQIYLPRGAHWIDVRTGEWHEGGQSVFVLAPLGKPPLLARAGTAVPVNTAELHFNREPDARGFLIFAAPDGGAFEARCFEDDGESDACLSGRYGEWVLRVSASAREISVHVALEGDVVSRPARLTLVFPAGEARQVSLSGAGRKIETSTLQDGSDAVTLSVS